MFNNPRYATRGIFCNLPLELQIMLWSFIDKMEASERDYLQVFCLSAENGKQKIVHNQEQPEYRREYLLSSENPVEAKIFVIDNGDHSTMLFAEEY